MIDPTEASEGFTFCPLMDGLVGERANLMAMRFLTQIWSPALLRQIGELGLRFALWQNLRRIKSHECALCQCTLRTVPHESIPESADLLIRENLSRIQQDILCQLRAEIGNGLLD